MAVALLLEAGADPDEVDERGRGLVQMALDHGHGDAARFIQAAQLARREAAELGAEAKMGAEARRVGRHRV